MLRVWILETGENYEGGYILSIHETAIEAKNAARDYMVEDQREWTKTGLLHWTVGCEWLTVRPFVIQPTKRE